MVTARTWVGILGIVAQCFFVGCGPRDTLGFTPVTGRVTFDGRPLERGQIYFTPDAAAGTTGPQSIGALQASGSFTLYGPGGRVGAVPGRHRVFLSIPGQDGPPPPPVVIDGKVIPQEPEGEPPGKVPKRFFSADTSGLTATVNAGEPATIEFSLAAPAPKAGVLP